MCIFLINASGNILKELVYELAVHILSYECTLEVGRTLQKLEKLSASPRATQTLFLCSPEFLRAFITR